MEKPADFLDAATEIAEAFTEAAILRVRKANSKETHPDFDGENCVICGETLIALRLTLGKIRCVDCQEHIERQQNRKF